MAKAAQHAIGLVTVLYLASSCVHGPVRSGSETAVPHWRLGPIVLARPMVLSGDSPHYLVAINSLLEDGDFNLRNNYDRARAGGEDMGARFRGVEIDRHVDWDRQGRELGTHSPFFAMLLAALVWPMRGTQWVEPACILLTLGISVFGLVLLRAKVESRLLLVLALATPLWCYARDLWTEPWVATIWAGMLVARSPAVLAILGFAGTLIKYPFAVVPITMGILAIKEKDSKRAAMLLFSGGAALLVVIGTVQHLFREVDHFSLFHSGVHAGFDGPFDGMLGLLASPENGLLVFFPALAWGLWRLPGRPAIFYPVLSFFLFHAAYQDWGAGTGFSARYLVPVLPALVLVMNGTGRLFRMAMIYSLFWGVLGAFFPALVYDRTPWGVFLHIFRKLPQL